MGWIVWMDTEIDSQSVVRGKTYSSRSDAVWAAINDAQGTMKSRFLNNPTLASQKIRFHRDLVGQKGIEIRLSSDSGEEINWRINEVF